jgi:cation diffusion facilitator CzcD-associated flavoprotein CzcO
MVGHNTLCILDIDYTDMNISDIPARKSDEVIFSNTTNLLDAYTFLFEPNPDWSHFYCPAPEIRAYIKRTVEKYNLDERVKFDSKVLGTNWDEDAGKWKITVDINGTITEDEADILVNGSGFLK